MANEKLTNAKHAKNDEFYTQYADIQKEINAYLAYNPDVFRDKVILLPCDDPEWSNFTKFFAQNFERFGIKKLISTSYACAAKGPAGCDDYCPTLFEYAARQYDAAKTKTHGKIFTLTRDVNQNGRIDIEDLEWDYLKGDGDFRSDEIKALRDEADIIVTNPPFSLFREFLAWIMDGDKKFLIIGNKNCVTYKEVFPLIKNNKMWVGTMPMGFDILFDVPESAAQALLKTEKSGSKYRIVDNVVKARASGCWFTNIEHGRRHQPMQLMTMADNIKFSRHKEIRGHEYQMYDNYDAIDVPYTDAIPSDYDGIMGVPITFLDKYCPEQFEIISASDFAQDDMPGWKCVTKEFYDLYYAQGNKGQISVGWPLPYYVNTDGQAVIPYKRIFIRKKKGAQ